MKEINYIMKHLFFISRLLKTSWTRVLKTRKLFG